MRVPWRWMAWSAAAVAAAGLLWPAAPASLADLQREFEQPPDDARIMMRWWWFGPSVVKPQLEREMRAMKEGGIGGFEVQPVYPLELDNPARGFRNLPYLSEEFLDNLRFTAGKARELGLRFDLTLGSGWPFGGPHIPAALAAARLRVDRVPAPANAASVAIPKLGDGERFIAAFLARGDSKQFSAEGVERLTAVDGSAVRLPAGVAGGRVVLFFIESRTRQTVKRPSVGADGFVLDHYSRASLDTHLRQVGEKLLGAVGKDIPYAIFSDSLEVYNADWTGDFLEEFRKRRGYDLMPYLPALAGNMGDKTAAIRHDWGKTLSELCDERYLTPMAAWAKQHGTKFRSQTYGIPPVTVSSGALIDLPEGEGTQWRRLSTSRWASSTSHLYGKPVTSSETWTWLHSPVFAATPLDMKAEADLHFIQGINQLIGHGWPYSPPEAGAPGWRFYAAAVLNNQNPWWLVMPDVATYMQRISYLLRQGEPANDVALYIPTADAFSGFSLGRASVNGAVDGLIGPDVIPAILDAGFNFDFIDDEAIAKLQLKHRIVILPNVERIPLATYQKLEEFVRNGGTLIAARRAPSLAPGMLEAERDTARIREISKRLFETGAGRLVADESRLGAAMQSALVPDVATAPEIGFVHRKLPFAEIYFLANTSNRPVRTQATFRVQGMQPAWWDPFTGKTTRAAGNRLELNLAPYESRVVVFGVGGGPGGGRGPGAAPAKPATTAPPAPIDISTGWTVTFTGAQPVKMESLRSWTEDAARLNYSGLAAYERTITAPAAGGQQVYLTFGEGTPVSAEGRRAGAGMRAMFEGPVREVAEVWVNGKRAGSVWCAPYELNVTGLLRQGENTIRVVVANTALNLLAKGPLPDYKELNAKYGERFQAQDMQSVRPLPSGMLGPVKLVLR